MKPANIIFALFMLGGCATDDGPGHFRSSAVKVFECDSPKVAVCHLPPGNPENAQSLCIAAEGVPAHLSEHDGDYLGECIEIEPPCEGEACGGDDDVGDDDVGDDDVGDDDDTPPPSEPDAGPPPTCEGQDCYPPPPCDPTGTEPCEIQIPE